MSEIADRGGTTRRRTIGPRGDGERSRLPQQRPWAQPRMRYKPTEVLSADELESIHEASLDVLEEIGMDFLDPEARDVLAACRREGRAGHATGPLRPRDGPRTDQDGAVAVHAPRPEPRPRPRRSAATGWRSAPWPARPTRSTWTAGGGSATTPTTRTSSASATCSTRSTSSRATRSSRSTSTRRSATSMRSTTSSRSPTSHSTRTASAASATSTRSRWSASGGASTKRRSTASRRSSRSSTRARRCASTPRCSRGSSPTRPATRSSS